MDYIRENPRDTRVRLSCDVLVVGGGAAGIVAALAAAENGASTVLIERSPYLGGAMINGATVLHSFFNLFGTCAGAEKVQLVRGIPQRIVDRMEEAGGCAGHVEQQLGRNYDTMATCFDHEIFKQVIFRMMEEAGVTLLLHAWMADVLAEGANIKGVIIESKSGREAILAKTVIDASGDADVAYKADPNSTLHDRDNIAMTFGMANLCLEDTVRYLEENEMIAQLVRTGADGRGRIIRVAFDLYRNPPFKAFLESTGMWGPWTASANANALTYINCTNVRKADGVDVAELTNAEMRLRDQVAQMAAFLRDNIPGFERGYVSWTASPAGVRRSRIVRCLYDLSCDDIENAARFSDEVFLYGFHDCAPARIVKNGGAYGFPYRALVPEALDHLLVAGRLVTSDWHAHMSTRNTVSCMAQGQAAGTAAALCAKLGVSPCRLDVAVLRSALQRGGAYLGAEG